MTLSVFYSFLADRFQAADMDGSLTLGLLKVRLALSMLRGHQLIGTLASCTVRDCRRGDAPKDEYGQVASSICQEGHIIH